MHIAYNDLYDTLRNCKFAIMCKDDCRNFLFPFDSPIFVVKLSGRIENGFSFMIGNYIRMWFSNVHIVFPTEMKQRLYRYITKKKVWSDIDTTLLRTISKKLYHV